MILNSELCKEKKGKLRLQEERKGNKKIVVSLGSETRRDHGRKQELRRKQDIEFGVLYGEEGKLSSCRRRGKRVRR